jgi:hydroxymethylpyrimidine/phosphomethylpyrimidine kinase
LIKGGHGSGDQAIDVLLIDGLAVELALPRLNVTNTHGTGCTLSAAITALLVLGVPLDVAVRRAKHYVWRALQAGSLMCVGGGNGPVDHLFGLRGYPLPS